MAGPRTRLSIGIFVGLGAVATLAAQIGVSDTLAVLVGLSWAGLTVIAGIQIGSFALCGLAWWTLSQRSSLLGYVGARWIREGTSNVLGIVPGIGELAGARALKLFGARSSDAAATTIVDIVAESLSQLLYTLCGLIPLLGAHDRSVLVQGLLALVAVAPPALVIYFVSRSKGALGLLERLLTGIGRALGFSNAARGLNLAANVARLYEHRGRILTATSIHLCAWFLGALQVWVAAGSLGRPVGAGTALALASVAYAARGALFIVPMGAGIQEAGFVLVGAVVGIDQATAIAFSLVLRARDVVLGVPAVLLWSVAELRELWRRGSLTAPAAP